MIKIFTKSKSLGKSGQYKARVPPKKRGRVSAS